MTNKNPYENDTIDIPDFVEDKSNTSSVDMSIFNMSDKELYDDNDLNEEYEEDNLNPKKNNKKVAAIIIIMGILIALLLAISAISIIGKSKAEAQVASLTAEIENLNAKSTKDNATIANLNETIKQKDEEIKKLKDSATKEETKKDSDSSSDVSDDETVYVVVNADGVVIREEPSADSQAIGSLGKDDKFEGYGTSTDSDGNIWVECWDGYICMKLSDGTVLVKAK